MPLNVFDNLLHGCEDKDDGERHDGDEAPGRRHIGDLLQQPDAQEEDVGVPPELLVQKLQGERGILRKIIPSHPETGDLGSLLTCQVV